MLVESVRRPRSRQTGKEFRPDIQGLRAVAVLLVALNHAGVRQLSGGYVGVDVFFVISGFLIAGWLMKRTARSGRVPFAEFYAARARRILPAATLTLVVTVVASYYLLNYVRALSAFHDAVWAAFFAANVHFAQVGTDYFARANPPSPVQQYWTLAVEEQFYLVWPATLALVLWAVALVRRRGRDGVKPGLVDDVAVRWLTVFVVLAVAASLAYSIRLTPEQPTSAYFSTLTRAWELGVGVLIALVANRLQALPRVVRVAMTSGRTPCDSRGRGDVQQHNGVPGVCGVVAGAWHRIGDCRRDRQSIATRCRCAPETSALAGCRGHLVLVLPVALAGADHRCRIRGPLPIRSHEPAPAGSRTGNQSHDILPV